MTSDSAVGYALAMLAGGAMIFVWLAWRRGGRAQADLKKRIAAQRAMYAQHAARDVDDIMLTPSRPKPEFGRR